MTHEQGVTSQGQGNRTGEGQQRERKELALTHQFEKERRRKLKQSKKPTYNQVIYEGAEQDFGGGVNHSPCNSGGGGSGVCHGSFLEGLKEINAAEAVQPVKCGKKSRA